MNKVFAIVLFVLLGGLCACEKEIPFNGKVAGEKLVINGFMNPDSAFKVHVSKSLSILANRNEKPEIVANALVKVSDEHDKFLIDLIYTQDGFYEAKHLFYSEPEPGKRYKLTVDALNLVSVSASDQLPRSLGDMSFKGKLGAEKTSTTVRRLGLIELTFTDNDNEDNFYIVSVKRVNHYDKSEQVFSISSKDINIDKLTDNDGRLQDRLFLKDNAFNGQSYTLNFTIHDSDAKQYSAYFITLQSCSEDYYRHLRTILKSAQNFTESFLHPVQVYSNIKNGIGIFGGVVSKTKEVYLND